MDAVTAAVAARKKDEKEDTKNKPTGKTNEGNKVSFIRTKYVIIVDREKHRNL